MVYPVPSKYPITTPYGKKGPMWSSGHHQGVDFACPVGTDIYAPIDAKVVGVGTNGTWGPNFGRHEIVLEFTAKRSALLPTKTYYAILAHGSQAFVKIGDVVKAGQLIGKSGAEGNVSGPHVHFEVQTSRWWTKTNDINPQFVLDWQPPAPVKPVIPAATTTIAGGKPGVAKPPVKKPTKTISGTPKKPVTSAPTTSVNPSKLTVTTQPAKKATTKPVKKTAPKKK